ncbi:MAG TPA: N-acetylneuraminate synthase family protein [Bryobacterales bacterium]|nr:N-acetylneuraminate synthase family protein [Bryobacterales bacterium]
MRTWCDSGGFRCKVIAEVAQNHDGSLGTAHAYIDAIAKTGADAVKFQTHIASAESTPQEPWRVKFSRQDATRYDYWKRMEFTEEQWRGLAEHAGERGLIFLSSAFSMEAVDLLERVGVPAWKVGAGEIGNLPMIRRMASTGKPVLLSSGLSGWDEIGAAVACVRREGAPVIVLQCTTAYPCPPEKVGLNVLGEIRERFHCPAGLSDHSGTIFAGLAAAALGAEVIEVHVAFSRECFGPDVPASITTAELAELVAGVRFIEKAVNSPVDKEAAASALEGLRQIFSKSIVAARDLPAGQLLTEGDLALRKPGTGIPPARLGQVVNRKLKRAVGANTLIAEADLE